MQPIAVQRPPSSLAYDGSIQNRSWLLRDVALPWLVTRLVLVSIAVAALNHADGSLPGVRRLLDCFGGFDGNWYVSVARTGYWFSRDHESSIAFAPLLPVLMRAVAPCFGTGDDAARLAGLIVSNAALLVGLAFVVALTRESLGDRPARRVGCYLLVCPGTLFLSAIYPMSLMLAIGAGSLYFAAHRKWGMATAIALFAPLARPDGVLILIPLAWAARHERGALVGLAAIPAVACLWLVGQWFAFGTPLAFIEAQHAWAPSPLLTVWHSSRAPLIFISGGFCVLMTVMGVSRLRVEQTIYAAVFLGMMLFAGRLWSLPRFIVILFPCLMTFASVAARSKILHVTFVVTCSTVAVIFMVRFALQLWVA